MILQHFSDFLNFIFRVEIVQDGKTICGQADQRIVMLRHSKKHS